MNNLENIRYVFTARTKDTVHSETDRGRLRSEIRSFLKDLADYKISLRRLAEQEVDYSDRNKLLNIALRLINEHQIAADLVHKKALPLAPAAQAAGCDEGYIEAHRDYVVAYMLLLGTGQHAFLARQLSIGTRIDGEKRPEHNNLGVKLKDFGITSVVLTPYGEFRFLDPARKNSTSGEFITGSKAVLKPRRALFLAALASALLLLFIAFAFTFNQPVRSFTVMGKVEASFSFNRFGRLTEARGHNQGARKVLEGIVYSDKKVDSTLARFLDEAMDQAELSRNAELTLIVVDGEFSDTEFKGSELMKEIQEHALRLKINQGGGEGFILTPPT